LQLYYFEPKCQGNFYVPTPGVAIDSPGVGYRCGACYSGIASRQGLLLVLLSARARPLVGIIYLGLVAATFGW